MSKQYTFTVYRKWFVGLLCLTFGMAIHAQQTYNLIAPTGHSNYQWYEATTGALAGETSQMLTVGSPGIYYADYLPAGETGCTQLTDYAVLLAQAPTCGETSVTLNAATVASGTCQWYQDGVAITGATNAAFIATLSDTNTVLYAEVTPTQADCGVVETEHFLIRSIACGVEICDNGIDDDGDNLIDCADPDCQAVCDTDGDGVPDGTDPDPNDPCIPVQAIGYTGYDATNPIWSGADCDGDNIDNGTEDTNGTDPYDPCDPAGSAVAVDCDNDGLTNNEELTGTDDPSTPADPDGGTTDPSDPDTDGDGVLDGTEYVDSTDPNDACDFVPGSITEPVTGDQSACDTDGDGVPDGTDPDPNDPCIPVQAIGYTGYDATNPIWSGADCDGDNIDNGTEDTNGTDPYDPCDPAGSAVAVDCDNDGLTNNEELTGTDDPSTPADPDGGTTDPSDPDTDGDGVLDGTEYVDSTDPNDACDFVPGSITEPVTGDQSACDTDGDGLPDSVDLDDDNDGITDVTEMLTAPPNGDTDGDGVPDHLDLDSDNDGINDVREADGTDNNNDGMADGAVGPTGIPSSAGNGLSPPDTDNDGQPDFQDLDSDNDTVSDLEEGGSGAPDADDDGVADGPDSDGDGIVDSADGNDNLFGDVGDPLPPEDPADADTIPDFRDVDSNGDGINDITENGWAQLDGDDDGMVDNPVDPDSDGIANNGGVDDKPTVFGGLGSPDVLKVSLRALLQGPYNQGSGLMNDGLRTGNLIPLAEPYTGLPTFAHTGGGGGETTVQAVLNTTGPDAIVDWMFVELRNELNPSQVVATRSGLLQRDGDIVDVDGTSPLCFRGTPADDYLIAIRHRNHLGVMTDNAVRLEPLNVADVDFTDPATAVYKLIGAAGSDHARRTVGNARVLWAGNVQTDNRVVFQGPSNDPSPVFFTVFLDPLNTGGLANFVHTGYDRSDVNLDGLTIFQGPNNEPDIIFFNVFFHPENTAFLASYIIWEQLP